MKYTEKEIKVLEVMKAVSIESSGQFTADENMSWSSINDFNGLFTNPRTLNGVLGSLIRKGAVNIDTDTGYTLYVANITEWRTEDPKYT